MEKGIPDLPKKTQLELWRLMHEMALPELLLLMRLHHGLEWRGDKTDLYVPELVELLVETGLALEIHPAGNLQLTPAGAFLARLVTAVWPGKPRAAGTPLPSAKPKTQPRPQLKLVKPSR